MYFITLFSKIAQYLLKDFTMKKEGIYCLNDESYEFIHIIYFHKKNERNVLSESDLYHKLANNN